MKTDAQYIIGDGTVIALAGGPLSLAGLGERTTRRISKIEFNPSSQHWEVETVEGTLLAEFADYDQALAWEREWFNYRLEILV